MSEEARAGAPDISRIISILMENPRLIEEITALTQASGEKTESAPEETVEEKTKETVAQPLPDPDAIRGRREQLLSALKPYLSDERQRAIDSIMTFAGVFDAIRRK